jgi:hypothetical protein
MIDIERRDTEILSREQPVGSFNRSQVVEEAEEPRVRFPHSFEIAGVQIMVPAIEVEPNPMVEERTPKRHLQLSFLETCKPIIGRPAIEEIAIKRDSLAEGLQVSRCLPRLSERGVDGV